MDKRTALRMRVPKGSTKASESPRDKDCTATVTLERRFHIIITKSESKTASGRTRSKDTTTEKRLSEQETTLVKSNKRSRAESECDLDSPGNKRLRIDVAERRS